MLRVFLDANVLFSASNADSNVARLIDLVIKQGEAVTSDFAAEEARRNVLLKRPNWAADLEGLIDHVELVRSIQFYVNVELSDKDTPILCTAIRSNCPYLATGDKRDFGHLYGQEVEGVTIITLAKLADLVAQLHTH